MHIWMLASENGALRGGKVGGVADVIRDLPMALAWLGHEVAVFTPGYGKFHQLPGAKQVAGIRLSFGGRNRVARLFRLPATGSRVRHFVVEHSLITAGQPGRIYFDDGPDRPFATDAGRYAFFCAAMAAAVEQSPAAPDVLHLHDWHTGLLPGLRRFDHSLRRLRSTRTVFTIHNLAYQGIRPLEGDRSSMDAWFPGLDYAPALLRDPRHPGCVNPMASGIRLADRLSTVSPGYAREILQASDPARGFIGGEGLEADLAAASAAGRLTGILNGCDYSGSKLRRPGWPALLEAIDSLRHLFRGNTVARRRLQELPRRRPASVLTSIGRVTDQKVALFLQQAQDGQTALEAILSGPARDAVFIMLGRGAPAMERRLMDVAERHHNFLFLRGYSESLPDLLYAAGDLFLMPSSFEPCGISQMLAMRSGQPCVAHAVGGLRDTIDDGENGFTFGGGTPRAQGRQFVAAVDRALQVKTAQPERWSAIRRAAAGARFTWEAAAKRYVKELYDHG
jgi:starch synthase